LLDEDGGERQSPLAGFLYAVGEDASLFVEERDPVVRRRFSVAHELGHYLLHFRPLLARLSARVGAPVEAMDALPKADDESEPDAQPEGQMVLPLYLEEAQTLPSLPQMEQEANRFAAELLMPEVVVRELAARYVSYFRDDDLVWRMANDLLVSRAAIRWRLRELGLLQPLRAHAR
jgi:Zn-dependent peptidase ImmA (M78 family)